MPRVKNDQFEGDIIHIPFFNKTIRMRTVNKDGFLCVEDIRDMYRLHRREYDIRMMIIQYKEEGLVNPIHEQCIKSRFYYIYKALYDTNAPISYSYYYHNTPTGFWVHPILFVTWVEFLCGDDEDTMNEVWRLAFEAMYVMAGGVYTEIMDEFIRVYVNKGGREGMVKALKAVRWLHLYIFGKKDTSIGGRKDRALCGKFDMTIKYITERHKDSGKLLKVMWLQKYVKNFLLVLPVDIINPGYQRMAIEHHHGVNTKGIKRVAGRAKKVPTQAPRTEKA